MMTEDITLAAYLIADSLTIHTYIPIYIAPKITRTNLRHRTVNLHDSVLLKIFC